MKKNVLAYGDSLLRRDGKNSWLDYSMLISNSNLIIDSVGKRDTDSLEDINIAHCNLIIVQLGIVDSIPRTNSSKSENFYQRCKTLRNIYYERKNNQNEILHYTKMPIRRFEYNLTKFYDRCSNHGIKLVFIDILTPHSWHENNMHYRSSETINKYNDVIYKTVNNVFSLKKEINVPIRKYSYDYFLEPSVEDDGTHLNFQAYKEYCEIFDNYLIREGLL